MRWRARPYRANISFFIFIMFFVVFGVIFLTQLLMLERPNTRATRTKYEELAQEWDARTANAVGELGEPPTPVLNPQDGVWQRVAGTRFRFYVYSAFVEMRTVAAVRIIAATKTRGSDPVICRLWLPDNRTLTLKAKVKAIRENWNLKYSAAYVLCLLESVVEPHETVGAVVSVVASVWANKPHTNLLIVQETKPKEGIEQNLHVCVKPFHSSFSRDDWLIEWFEFNILLGASHFYMYNHSTSAAVSCVLDHYRRKGMITLLPWNLPILSKVEIRTEGQFAAFNDCLYRSMSKAEWLLVIDVDELVLPRHEETLLRMLKSLRADYLPRVKLPSAFLFRNVFFYLYWQDDSELKSPLLTARKTRRRVTPLGLRHRSKYVVRPRDMVELGNHFVWEHAPNAVSAGVAANRALVHHYRAECENDDLECLRMSSLVDRTAHRWSNELLQRFTEAKKQMEDSVCIV